jgi:hypothetical protein
MKGVEFVDVEATISSKRDMIAFITRDEYVDIPRILSEDDFDKLIYLGP